MKAIFRPIAHWPGEPTRSRRPSPFKAGYSDTLQLLDRELNHLNAKQIVIQLALRERDIRLDGMPRADASPSHPGVILAFESRHGSLSYPCDTFTTWEANLRAIALSLEHLRAVDRYGVTKRGEQYRGWERLPEEPGAVTRARDLLKRLSGIEPRTKEGLVEAYRIAAMKAHPDRGGSSTEFREVVNARDILVEAGLS